jgi:hypothetical protein
MNRSERIIPDTEDRLEHDAEHVPGIEELEQVHTGILRRSVEIQEVCIGTLDAKQCAARAIHTRLPVMGTHLFAVVCDQQMCPKFVGIPEQF